MRRSTKISIGVTTVVIVVAAVIWWWYVHAHQSRQRHARSRWTAGRCSLIRRTIRHWRHASGLCRGCGL